MVSEENTMQFNEAKIEYVSYIKTELKLAKTTCATYSSWLNHYSKWLVTQGQPNPTVADALKTATLRNYRKCLDASGRRPRTILGAFHPIKGMCVRLKEQKILRRNPMDGVTLPGKDAATRVKVTDDQVSALLGAVERQLNPDKVALSRALLSTLIYTGIRAQELCDLRMHDVNFQDLTLLVARGKGNKSRELYPPQEFWDAIKPWLAVRDKMGCDHDYVWAQTRTRRLSDDYVRRVIEELKAIAGLRDAVGLKPHGFRHWFAKNMERNGAVVRTIQQALGHRHPGTTYEYLRMDEQYALSMRTMASFTPKVLEPTHPVATECAVVSQPVPPQIQYDSANTAVVRVASQDRRVNSNTQVRRYIRQ